MKEQTESNNLICVFMGDDPEAYLEGELRYHESWNQLMPVLTKIAKYENPDWMRDIMVNGTVLTLIKLDIEITYCAVINFITWYNTHNKK